MTPSNGNRAVAYALGLPVFLAVVALAFVATWDATEPDPMPVRTYSGVGEWPAGFTFPTTSTSTTTTTVPEPVPVVAPDPPAPEPVSPQSGSGAPEAYDHEDESPPLGQGTASGACGGDLPPCWVMMAESGGDPSAVNATGCGGYGCFGKWQFDPRTSQGLGYPLTMNRYPESVQDDAARALWAGGAGCSHWGAC